MANEPLEIQPHAVYTMRDACQILQVGSITLSRWVKEGKVSSARIGRGYRFLGSQILEALALPEPTDETPAPTTRRRRL